MLTASNKTSLRWRPSLLFKYGEPVGANWIEALLFVVELEADIGRLLSNYYHSLPTVCRPSAAQAIANSNHRHAMMAPDAPYVQAWLLGQFYEGRGHLRVSDDPRMDLSKASVLSNWLKVDPSLVPTLSPMVSIAFHQSGSASATPYAMDMLLTRTVARKYRTKSFYTEMLKTTATLLEVCAKYIDESTALTVLSHDHCKHAAGLGQQWSSVYPQSALAPKINALLSTMDTLGRYDANFLREGLGIQASQPAQELSLPDVFAP